MATKPVKFIVKKDTRNELCDVKRESNMTTECNTKITCAQDDDIDCPICQEYLKGNDLVRLLCYHAFHHDCVLDWYKVAQNKYDTIRTCPLCRENGGYLPLKRGQEKISGIHWTDQSAKSKQRYYSKPSVPIAAIVPCKATIQSKKSVNYGKACGNTALYDGYCGTHKSLS